MHAGMEGQAVPGRNLVFQVGRSFIAGHVRPVVMEEHGIAEGPLLLRLPPGKGLPVRDEDVPGQRCPETDGMGGGRGILEIRTKGQVGDTGKEFARGIHACPVTGVVDPLLAFRGHPDPVAGQRGRGVGEQPAAENMVPPEGRDGISPMETEVFPVVAVPVVGGVVLIIIMGEALGFLVIQEGVPAVVETRVEPVTVPEPVDQFRVGIVEPVIDRRMESAPDQRVQESGVEHPPAQGEGRVLPEGSVEVDLFGKQARRHAAVQSFGVAVIGPHVHHAGGPSGIAGRERTLVQGYLFDGFRGKDGEDSTHVVDVVQRDAVQQDQVLVGPAATHVNT